MGRSKNENTRNKQQIETLQKEVIKLQLETDRQTQEIQNLKQRVQSKEESIDWRDVKISEIDNYYRSFMENNAKHDREFKQQIEKPLNWY